ncbi:hypothetical protein DPEC_G00316640 [Dallia pectoralis]|uniref:Uncharacterized protein n=1 Tax=Dallia pectoralis TaxID=75939 RepID=A0ACC2FCT7_DALPE|nr:hypothetical protein DPEC_G00316640 [Dallia pectoralis]
MNQRVLTVFGRDVTVCPERLWVPRRRTTPGQTLARFLVTQALTAVPTPPLARLSRRVKSELEITPHQRRDILEHIYADVGLWCSFLDKQSGVAAGRKLGRRAFGQGGGRDTQRASLGQDAALGESHAIWRLWLADRGQEAQLVGRDEVRRHPGKCGPECGNP